MVDFTKLKKMSSGSVANLSKAMEKLNKSSFDDDKKNYWTPTLDKEGNGSAIIRFIPSKEFFEETEGLEENETFFVRIFTHAFQGPTGKWYIENSLTTLDQDDPVGKHNSELWNSGIDAKKEVARAQKRKLSYISNILVIRDPANPENNGKVFLYKYGKMIMDKIKGALAADPALDETPVSAFDIFETGANFRLKIRRKDKFPNYDMSEFDRPEALSEAQIEYIAANAFPILPEVAPDKFKSYEVLEKRMNVVLDLVDSRPRKAAEDDEPPFEVERKMPDAKSNWDTAAEEDADLDYFKQLAED